MAYQILLVEDDGALRETVTDYLTAKGLVLTTARDGAQGLELAGQRLFDLILLDVMLPGADGFTLCRHIRETSDVPVMFLTARTLEEDKLRGYGLGCDDYLVKPFSLAELYVRAMALIRRSKGLVRTEVLTAGAISLNPVTGQAFLEEAPMELTRKEYLLLKYLLEHKNQVISRATLLDCVWGWDFTGSDRVVDNHIRKLRKHLGKEAGRIRTVIGMGYKLEVKL